MFSGIVQGIGIVKEISQRNWGSSIVVSLPNNLLNNQIGDSIAVNGVCLTITKMLNELVHFDLIQETLSKTTFDELKVNDFVNVEYAMTMASKIGGHYVQGHIDLASEIHKILNENGKYILYFKLPKSYQKLIIPTGFIAIDGISLTVVDCDCKEDLFYVALIPHTYEATIAKYYRVGSRVNLEVDVLGKYIATYMGEAI